VALPLTVVDTTVLIDALRGQPAAQAFLLGVERRLLASEITRLEILRVLRSNERATAEAVFRALRWIPLDESIARRAGALGREWRRSHALAVADLAIAATALEFGADLATANVRHFPMFEGLRPPY